MLDRMGLSSQRILSVAGRARLHDVPVIRELLVTGEVGETDFYRALAAELEIGFLAEVDPARLADRFTLDTPLLRETDKTLMVRCHAPLQESVTVIAPDCDGFIDLRRRLRLMPEIRHRLRIAPPTIIRAAVSRWLHDEIERQATSGLFDRWPAFSARFVMPGWQGVIAGIVVTAGPVALFLAPGASMHVIHALALALFLGCIFLRVGAMAHAAPPRLRRLRPVIRADLPVYSVLVALYREADMLPELVKALERLEWPRSKLDIKLVCEADDPETIKAARALRLPPHFEIVEVPRSSPRTKPKALSYALSMVRGAYVVLYDAEDNPQPRQLIEAYQAFQEDGEGQLACVQAPLEISNRHDAGLVASMFAFEYSALFHGLLPWLAARRLVLPLGGTSNHFRADILRQIGGWDPHNVTEDADIGIRLARHGYRTGTITRPTWELAPTRWTVWLPQRSRWLKGWAQTWLVHMREPRKLFVELGVPSFCVAQILMAGMIASAFAHPLLFGSIIYHTAIAYMTDGLNTWQSAILLLDIASVVGGYMSFILLGRSVLSRRKMRGTWRVAIYTPVYWFMLFFAALKAIWQLFVKPHHWEKTPHVPRRPTAVTETAGRKPGSGAGLV